MQARILSVYDEGALEHTPLIGAHGQGFIIDVDGERTLFDTGMRGRYLMHNLKRLKVDPDSIDRVVISHGHKDHAGGLPDLLRARSSPVDVYMHPEARVGKRKGPLGIPILPLGFPKLDDEEASKMNLHDVTEWTELSPHLHLTGEITDRADIQGLARKLVRRSGDSWVQDVMKDEMSLVILASKGPVLLTGCGHPGLTNIMRHVVKRFPGDLQAVIGGAHMAKFKKEEVDRVANIIIEEFETPQLYLNHCTGDASVTRLRESLTLDGVRDFYVGMELSYDL